MTEYVLGMLSGCFITVLLIGIWQHFQSQYWALLLIAAVVIFFAHLAAILEV